MAYFARRLQTYCCENDVHWIMGFKQRFRKTLLLKSVYHVTTPIFTVAGGRIYNSMCPLVVGGHPKNMDDDIKPYKGYMDQVGMYKFAISRLIGFIIILYMIPLTKLSYLYFI